MRNVSATYVAGEDESRLANAAKYFGIQNTRTPFYKRQTASNTTNQHSYSIVKFGSTAWRNVGLLFSDSTLEAARMHSVGVLAKEEHIKNGRLHLMSVKREWRQKHKSNSYSDLLELFQKKPLQPLEYGESSDLLEEDVVDTVEGGSMGAAIFGDLLEEDVVDTVEGGSMGAAIFGIVKGTVGCAVLFLPRGFSLAGYGVAVPSMLVAMMTYLYSATRLLECWKVETENRLEIADNEDHLKSLLETNEDDEPTKSNYGSINSKHDGKEAKVMLTYPELARIAFGKASFIISGGIAACIACMQFGVCLTYLIYVPQNLYECTRDLFGIVIPKSFFLIGMLLLEIPLVWIRDIRRLTPFNVLATLLIAFGLSSCLYIAIFGMQVEDGSNLLREFEERLSALPIIGERWFLFIGTSFFCFEGTITLVVPLQEAVYSQVDRERFPRINQIVIFCIVLFEISFAMICWTAFGDSVKTALTASLPRGKLTTIVQMAYSIAIMFTFPLQAYPALQVAITESDDGKLSPTMYRNVQATIIMCILGIIAVLAIDYLGNVVSLLGSLVGVPIALIFPPLMHNQLVKVSTFTKSMNVCVATLGIVAMMACSYNTISSWNEGSEG